MSALGGAEAAGDFHFHFHHPERLFGEIVGEGNFEVDQEAQHVVFESVQAKQQIVSGPAFRAAAFGAPFFEAGKVAMPGEALAQGFPVAGVEGFERSGGEGGFAVARGLLRPLCRRRGDNRVMACAQVSLSNWISALSSRK